MANLQHVGRKEGRQGLLDSSETAEGFVITMDTHLARSLMARRVRIATENGGREVIGRQSPERCPEHRLALSCVRSCVFGA